MYKKIIAVFFFGLFCLPYSGLAQTEPEDIAMVSDEFQDAFYESLLQKGIENYDKAIVALEKCLASQPNNATVHFELGKNYLALKQYENAHQSFQKATKIEPKNRWFWVGMYDVGFQTKNYERAMVAVEHLIHFDEMYKDDLIPLYIATNQSDKALTVITEMNAKFGKSQERTQFKNQILRANKTQKTDWQELTAFKNYLDSNEGDKAIESMNSIFSNSQIDNKVKHRVLNEFLIFVSKNPKYEPDLQKAVLSFKNNKEVNTAMEIGKFFQKKNQMDLALKYYELALDETNNLEINLLLLQAYTAIKQFQKVEQKATDALELYPAQAEFYYYLGLAKNQLQQYQKAKEVLETGFDFVIDNLDLEINFNLQLAEAYNGLGDFKKKELYFARANELVTKKK